MNYIFTNIPVFIIAIFLLVFCQAAYSQVPLDSIDIETMSLEEIKQLSHDVLLELPLQDLMLLAKRFKVSSIEELYELMLNPDVETASKRVEETLFSPLSTTVITREEIDNSGVTSIPEALRLSAGLIVRQKTNGNYDVHIRGNDNVPPGRFLFDSENSMTLVMIDNRIVYNYFQGGTFWETLPVDLNDIDRIEVIRGPASALYGPNAVTGVINIITQHPQKQTTTVRSNVQYGNYNTLIHNHAIELPLSPKMQVKLSGNYHRLDRFQDAYLLFQDYNYVPSDSLNNYLIQNKSNFIESPELARENYAVNAHLYYSASPDLQFELSGGMQKSHIQSVFLDIGPLALSTRQSHTNYLHAQSEVYGAKILAAYQFGNQNNAYGFPGYHFDIGSFQSLVEYPLQWGNFSIRPGVAFNHTFYDDSNYSSVDEEGDTIPGYFNGRAEIRNCATSLRLDYLAFDRLRLIAALRNDFYSTPAETYFSYQFISSYSMNEKHLLRAVYSRANRGPFMYDFHVNYYNEQVFNGYTYITEFRKNEHLNLTTMDMYEIGIRNRWLNNLQTDFELFHSQTDDYNEITYTQYQDMDNLIFGYYGQKENIDVVAHQYGVSATVGTVFSSRLQFNIFGTWQTTTLKDFVKHEWDEDTYKEEVDTVDFAHRSTPQWYGGMYLNYKPLKNLNLNSNLYYYSAQEFYSVDGITEIEQKLIANFKLSYMVRNDNSIYLNIRNLRIGGVKEFAFADDIRPLFLFGLKLNL